MKKILFFAIVILGFYSIQAQQDPMFTHYMYNTLTVNSGYAGSRDVISVSGLHRTQWVSFPGAPTTQTVILHGPMNDKVGLGLSFVNDKLGPEKTAAIYGDFSYRLKITEKSNLALGIKGGVNFKSIELSKLDITQGGDSDFSNDLKSGLLPNFGFGAYYFTDRFYFGVSIPKLLENEFSVDGGDVAKLNGEKRHYFVIAGTVLDITKDGNIKLKPTTLLKITNGAPIDWDVTAEFIYKDKFLVGPMFRMGDGFGLLAGFNVSENLFAGYSFDFSTLNKTAKYNGGSHELMLRYDFIMKIDRIRSPRYF